MGGLNFAAPRVPGGGQATNAAVVFLMVLAVVTLVVALVFTPEREPDVTTILTAIPTAVTSPTVPTVNERLIRGHSGRWSPDATAVAREIPTRQGG
jgi:autotransporter translocation and assembly factor TamB